MLIPRECKIYQERQCVCVCVRVHACVLSCSVVSYSATPWTVVS